MSSYNTSDFSYSLPDELIAQYPLEKRTASRLLCCDPQANTWQDHQFTDLLDMLSPGDLMVFNDTQVIPARLYGNKQSGGAIEILLERMQQDNKALAHIRSSKSPAVGSYIYLRHHAAPKNKAVNATNFKIDADAINFKPEADAPRVQVISRQGALFELQFAEEVLPLLQKYGHQPLPPYITRAAETIDDSRYQTVWAKNPGAVAAPTASLHFDEEIISKIKNKGVQIDYVTLHVGAGTFQPLRGENLSEHVMHAEYLQLSEQLCEKIKLTRAAGGRIIAVGTTVVRCLEEGVRQANVLKNKQRQVELVGAVSGESSAADDAFIAENKVNNAAAWIMPFSGDTRLFIYPGYKFGCVDAMLTNFHLPKSSLLMLVSAFAGFEFTKNIYAHAVAKKYRFFSYGDAMWLDNKISI